MSDDEDDYMSDKFLAAGNDVRPSLIQNRAKKRQVEIVTKKTESIKRQREEHLERSGARRNEQLQESLQRPIEAENKGFQMLARMGYKPGCALGRQTAAADAIIEPIGISVKMDRGGLGREEALRELAAKRRQMRQQRLQKQAGAVVSMEEFRRRANQKAEERFMHAALRRCQQSCENLDTKAGLEAPEMPWFWPEREAEAEDQDDEESANEEEEAAEDEYSDVEKMELLTGYLRTSYQFCFWCGEQYKDTDDLNANCPGLTRDEH